MDASQVTLALTEKVRVTAYKIYEERVRQGEYGTAEGDWLRAEAFVRPYKPYVELAAYGNWQRRIERGEPGGDALSDWLSAEAVQAIYKGKMPGSAK